MIEKELKKLEDIQLELNLAKDGNNEELIEKLSRKLKRQARFVDKLIDCEAKDNG